MDFPEDSVGCTLTSDTLTLQLFSEVAAMWKLLVMRSGSVIIFHYRVSTVGNNFMLFGFGWKNVSLNRTPKQKEVDLYLA